MEPMKQVKVTLRTRHAEKSADQREQENLRSRLVQWRRLAVLRITTHVDGNTNDHPDAIY